MYSMSELYMMNEFERELSIIENRFDYMVESAYQNYLLYDELSESLFIEKEEGKEEKEPAIVRMFKSFIKALRSMWDSITGVFKKAFSKTPDKSQLREGTIKVKDPEKMVNATTSIVSDGVEVLSKVVNGKMSPEEGKKWVESKSEVLNNIGTVATTAGSILGVLGVKHLTIDKVNREIDDVLKNAGSDLFKNSYTSLSRLTPGDDYDAKKRETVNSIMSLIRKTDNKFLNFVKDTYARIYIGNKLDSHAEALNDPRKAKELLGDKKEDIRVTKRDIKTFAGLNKQRQKTSSKFDKLSNKQYTLDQRLDEVLSDSFDNYDPKYDHSNKKSGGIRNIFKKK